MINRKKICACGLLIAMTIFAGCGTDQEVVAFQKNLDTFCGNVSKLDAAINQIDPNADDASALALSYLDKLEIEFQNFAELDFPKEYDYLEPLADESAKYMTESVKNYHAAFEGETFNQETADYARENSARAVKRVQVILDVLKGEYEEPSSSDASAAQN